MTGLEETRREFWDAWNGLSEVHTQEDLESQSEKMWAARKRLWKIDPEFRATMKTREDKANVEAEESERQIRSKHNAIVSEAEAEVAAAMTKARAVMRMPDGELDEWVQKHRFKALTSDEAKTRSKLICPICHGPDRFNIMNGVPICFHGFDPKKYGPPHKLVPESELKNYNRDYRRRWKRNRKR